MMTSSTLAAFAIAMVAALPMMGCWSETSGPPAPRQSAADGGPEDPAIRVVQAFGGTCYRPASLREFSDDPVPLPADEPLTQAAYTAGPVKRAYVEPTAVGRALIDMPLFLEPEIYINVPLEATYQAAYRGVPRRWRAVLEGRNS